MTKDSIPDPEPSSVPVRSSRLWIVLVAVVVLAAAAYSASFFISRPNPAPDSPIPPDQREAAEDAQKLLNLKPGAALIAHDPWFAEVWNGKAVPIGETPSEVAKQIKDGRGEFVVVDDFTIRRHLPALKALVSGVDAGGAGLVYRRYLRQYDRLFSVYRAGAKPLEVRVEIGPDTSEEEVTALLVKARQYYEHGYVEHARQMLAAITKARPGLALAHRELMKVYLVLGYFDGSSLDLAESEMIRYAFLTGDKNQSEVYRKTLLEMRARHDALWGVDQP